LLRLSTHHDIFPLYLLSDLILYIIEKIWSIWYRGIDGNTLTWRRVEHVFEANAANHNSSLQITTTRKGVVWLDQISAMPLDTYKVCWSHFYYLRVKICHVKLKFIIVPKKDY
jgi:uncharacterized membrane protein YfbV (UPF0208 family)